MSSGPRSCIVLTRPKGRNQLLAATLRSARFNVLELPVLAVSALPYDISSFAWPQHYQLIVFVSVTAVEHYLARLKAMQGAGQTVDFGAVILAAVGPSTAARLRLEPEFRHARVVSPSQEHTFDSEGLLATLNPDLPAIDHVLIVRGQSGRDWLAEQLTQQGKKVERYSVYQRHSTVWSDADFKALRQCVHQGGRLSVLLTSTEAVDAFCTNLRSNDLAYLLEAMRFVVLHERIASRLQSQLQTIPDAQVMLGVKLCAPDDESMLRALMLSATI